MWRASDAAVGGAALRLVVSKVDLPEAQERWPEIRAALRRDGHEPIAVSAHDGTGLPELRADLTCVKIAHHVANHFLFFAGIKVHLLWIPKRQVFKQVL